MAMLMSAMSITLDVAVESVEWKRVVCDVAEKAGGGAGCSTSIGASGVGRARGGGGGVLALGRGGGSGCAARCCLSGEGLSGRARVRLHSRDWLGHQEVAALHAVINLCAQ